MATSRHIHPLLSRSITSWSWKWDCLYSTGRNWTCAIHECVWCWWLHFDSIILFNSGNRSTNYMDSNKTQYKVTLKLHSQVLEKIKNVLVWMHWSKQKNWCISNNFIVNNQTKNKAGFDLLKKFYVANFILHLEECFVR